MVRGVIEQDVTRAETLSESQDRQEEQQLCRMPRQSDEMVAQAADAARRAATAGHARQIQRLALPAEFAVPGVSEWPGGRAQQYEVAEPLVRALLRKLDRAANGGVVSRLKTQVTSREDYTALVLSEAPERKDDCAAILNLTAEAALEAQTAAFLKEMGPRLVVLVNPGWNAPSDFGFFARRRAETLLAPFLETYTLVKFTCRSQKVALLRSWPGPWTLYAMAGEDRGAATKWDQVAVLHREDRPSYRECEKLLDAKASAAA
eukprot:TRINITY_DN855_c0_g1_i1.p1 TRINITY_DN855_c0_g1~~TRINITY_DN855_c0_g1_i1.p1  ORF type:complete len:262 (-),score=75.95 TRINITY_DN855_c0_g1_i1:466-1251(-)